MDIKELKSQTPKLIDLDNLEPIKKSRGRPKKTKPVEKAATEKGWFGFNKSTDEKVQDEATKITEKDKLKEELLRLSDYNDEIITKPVNDKLGKLIDEMDITELRARIRQGRKITSKKMDTTVASQVIFLANQMAGSLLDCTEELNKSTEKDILLQETTKDYLAVNVLDYIPTELKMMGLYGSHVGASYYKASAKKVFKKKPIIVEEKELKEEKSEDSEPVPELVRYDHQDDAMNALVSLKNKLEGFKTNLL